MSSVDLLRADLAARHLAGARGQPRARPWLRRRLVCSRICATSAVATFGASSWLPRRSLRRSVRGSRSCRPTSTRAWLAIQTPRSTSSCSRRRSRSCAIRPLIMREMLRVGRHAIVTFPNFGYWRVRGYLAFRGRMPISESIPFSWYDTPNIHHTTLKDFREFVSANGGEIEREIPLIAGEWRQHVREAKLWPNLLADTAVAVVRAKQ